MVAVGTCIAGPHLGAQFAQLVKELRSEYAAAVTACAERIAGALFQRPGYSINATLHRHGISGTPSIMQQQVCLLPMTCCQLVCICIAVWPSLCICSETCVQLFY